VVENYLGTLGTYVNQNSGADLVKSHLKSGTQYVFKVTATRPEANKMNTYNFSNPVEKFVP